MKLIRFEAEDFRELQDILAKDSGSKISMNCPFGNSIMFSAEQSNNELYLKSGADGYLVISRIAVAHKRSGVGTSILDWLKSYAVEKGFVGIMVESVITTEMVSFCEKHNFKFEDRWALSEKDRFGNWYLRDIKNFSNFKENDDKIYYFSNVDNKIHNINDVEHQRATDTVAYIGHFVDGYFEVNDEVTLLALSKIIDIFTEAKNGR